MMAWGNRVLVYRNDPLQQLQHLAVQENLKTKKAMLDWRVVNERVNDHTDRMQQLP